MGVGVERHLAPHRRVRTHVDRRRQRIHRAADGDVSDRARRSAQAHGASALHAAGPEQRRRDFGKPDRGQAGGAASVWSSGRGRRACLLRSRNRLRQPDLHGDRGHELRRDCDEQGEHRRHRPFPGRWPSSGAALRGGAQRRRRRRHDRWRRRRGHAVRGSAGSWSESGSRRLWPGRNRSHHHRRADRARSAAAGPVCQWRGGARCAACCQGHREARGRTARHQRRGRCRRHARAARPAAAARCATP